MKKKNDSAAKAARYAKYVEWSDEDQCFIGRCPDLFAGGVHGDDETKVYKELCDVVAETIDIIESDGRPLPAASSSKDFSGKFLIRTTPEHHHRIALRARANGMSLTEYVLKAV